MNTNSMNPIVRSEARCVIVMALYASRFSEVSDQALRKELQDAGHDGGREWIHQDVHYLSGKKLVAYRTLPAGPVVAMLTAVGCDFVERSEQTVVGVDSPPVDALQVHQIRERRWHILNALSVGRVAPVRERTILLAINDVGNEITETALRRELVYLEQLGLVTLDRSAPTWLAEITPEGTDIVSFVTPDAQVPAGIDRIPMYW